MACLSLYPKSPYQGRQSIYWNRTQLFILPSFSNKPCIPTQYLNNMRYHQMKTLSVLLDLCAGNSLVTSEFSTQGPVMQSFDVFFDLCLNHWLSK